MSDGHKKQQESIKKVLMVLKGFEIKICVKRKKKYPGITMIFKTGVLLHLSEGLGVDHHVQNTLLQPRSDLLFTQGLHALF